MRRALLVAGTLTLTLIVSRPASAVSARMLRFPDVSASQIAFVYAGDVWVVAKEGGVAQRLSTPDGEERFPRFSPDGTLLAYTAAYDGNPDIYIVPVEGGVPARITHNPSDDLMLDWYPQGDRVLFATTRTSGKDRFHQLYEVARQGGLATKLPPPYGEFGAVSPDGTTLAYMPLARDFRTWKRYRGGMAPDIWLFDLKTLSSRNLTDNPANDSQPMWHGTTLYFLSDRGPASRANIWATDTVTGATRQVTHFEDYDIHFPAIGPSDLVFEAAGKLYLMNLADESTREVGIEVVTDKATLKPRVQKVADLIESADISPSGKRAVIEARGDVFSVPAEHGVVLDLTRTPGVAERFPAWSPDGEWLAYFSDAGGEYELTVRPADGSGSARTITALGPGFRYHIRWSPDSKKVAFIDQTMTINVVNMASGEVKRVDKANYFFEAALERFQPSWSSDSRWLAYSRDLPSRASAVFLIDMKTGEKHQVTQGFYTATSPVFDPDGAYLYFLTDRTFEPTYSDFQNSWIYANATNVAAVPLRKDGTSPLAPRNDVEKADKDEKKDTASDKKEKKPDTKEEKKDEPKPVEIEIPGFEERVVILPFEAGNYRGLDAVSGKIIAHRTPRTGSASKASPVIYWDLEEREEKTIIPDADSFTVSADGKKMLISKDGALAIVDVAAEQKLEKHLATDRLEMTVDPMAEWRQIFSDVWRFERDFFYDPGMHGVDWDAMRARYGALIDDAVTRWDVNFVIGELIAELSASHTYRGGGDVQRAPRQAVGLLGVDFALENGAYRITKILRGAPWDSEVRSPLDQPGVNAREGDYILAVNHTPLDTSRDPWAAFAGLAGQTVLLALNDTPTMDGAREVLVETMESEYRLRNLAWINANRLKVEQATDGKVGYVYVPDTGLDGQTELMRQFVGQFTKPGLIIDERFNSGGQIPDRFVELLNRPLYNYWAVRDGHDWQWPPVAHQGPTVMLINGWSGSGGDAFPFYFRKAGVGTLIGMRTWGGLIGISGAPPLIDGGGVTVPTFGIYSTDGQWIIEGHGVEPDIEVIDDPTAMARGGDPQLEKAIEVVLKQLAENPPTAPERPQFPVRSGH